MILIKTSGIFKPGTQTALAEISRFGVIIMDTTLNKIDQFHEAYLNDRINDREEALKGLYEKFILPRIIHFVCGLKPLMKQLCAGKTG